MASQSRELRVLNHQLYVLLDIKTDLSRNFPSSTRLKTLRRLKIDVEITFLNAMTPRDGNEIDLHVPCVMPRPIPVFMFAVANKVVSWTAIVIYGWV